MGPGRGPSPAETARVLREPPPAPTVAWVVEALSADGVEDIVAMRGGSSSAMHRLVVRSGRARRDVVLRRYVLADLLDSDPGVPAREVDVLRLVADLAVPTPELLAADVTAAESDVPAIVMTAMPGRVVWEPTRPAPWLDRLAQVAVAIHELPLPGSTVARFRPYRQRSYAPPRWTSHPLVWGRAVELFQGPAPDPDETFIHRDLHPGNVLWERQRVSAVVDWQAAALGPPSLDVAHCRLNLLLYRPDLADRLRRRWEQLSGRAFHPWSDVVAIVGMLDGLRDHPPGAAARRAIDETLGRAVSDLTG